jgi:hypothetical protein
MHINTFINKIKKPRGRPKKVKLDVPAADKLFPSHSNLEEIEIKTPIVISKSESPNKSYKNNENWVKRKCLCCNKIFDSWGIGNRLCKSCK